MEIMRYTTGDFVLMAYCHHMVDRYATASRRIRDIDTATQYRIDGAAGRLSVWSPEINSLIPIEANQAALPVFFENTDYHFEITFIGGIEQVKVQSQLRSISERFIRKKGSTEDPLTGWLNFGNDVGSCDFILLYQKNGEQKRWALQFEVFSTKLDLRTDHQTLVRELEKAHFGLSMDLLKRTYMNFRPLAGEGNDLTWWSIFGSIFRDLIGAVRFALNKPHSRLVSRDEFRTWDQLKVLTSALEEEWVRYEENPTRLYRVTGKILSSDNTENRFLKYVVNYAWQKFSTIREYIEKTRGKILSNDRLDEIGATGRELQRMLSHPFFRLIGEFRGITQESAVLQKRAGYSAVYASWIMLRRSVELFEGISKIEHKNIADLYQYWCFLKIRDILQLLPGVDTFSSDLAEADSEDLLLTLKRGQTSRAAFVTSGGDKIELFHEYTFDLERDNVYFDRIFTEIQRPDITLRVTKNDLPDPYIFTWLFDAKYRVEQDRVNKKCDGPPIDAINQMHRYRDAIFHLDETGASGKEVIGGYILFPGLDPVEDVRQCSYFTSITAIDIGGFPLVPSNRYQNNSLLEEHLKQIIHADTHSLLRKVIPQKGLKYGDTNPLVLIWVPFGAEQATYTHQSDTVIYSIPLLDATGRPHAFDLGNIKYLALVEDGIYVYYQIDNIMIRHDDTNNRLFYVFYLSYRRALDHKIPVLHGEGGRFSLMKLSEFKKAHIFDFNS